jgi:hypothetical protein
MWPRKSLYTGVFAALAGCASVGGHQTECQQLHGAFSEMVDCLTKRVRGDPALSNDANVDIVNSYLETAHLYVEQVREGKLSEGEARVGLARSFVALKKEQDARSEKAAQDLGATLRALREQRRNKDRADTSQNYAPPQAQPPSAPMKATTSRVAQFCVTQSLTCRMGIVSPPGVSCFCPSPNGAFAGMTR